MRWAPNIHELTSPGKLGPVAGCGCPRTPEELSSTKKISAFFADELLSKKKVLNPIQLITSRYSLIVPPGKLSYYGISSRDFKSRDFKSPGSQIGSLLWDTARAGASIFFSSSQYDLQTSLSEELVPGTLQCRDFYDLLQIRSFQRSKAVTTWKPAACRFEKHT